MCTSIWRAITSPRLRGALEGLLALCFFTLGGSGSLPAAAVAGAGDTGDLTGGEAEGGEEEGG